jgi:hypothetical protein
MFEPTKTFGSNTVNEFSSIEFGNVGVADPAASIVTKFGMINPLKEDTNGSVRDDDASLGR